DCAAQAAVSGGQAGSAGVEAREPAVKQGSAPEAVGSAFLLRPYAEFTGVADREQAARYRITCNRTQFLQLSIDHPPINFVLEGHDFREQLATFSAGNSYEIGSKSGPEPSKSVRL